MSLIQNMELSMVWFLKLFYIRVVESILVDLDKIIMMAKKNSGLYAPAQLWNNSYYESKIFIFVFVWIQPVFLYGFSGICNIYC